MTSCLLPRLIKSFKKGVYMNICKGKNSREAIKFFIFFIILLSFFGGGVGGGGGGDN